MGGGGGKGGVVGCDKGEHGCELVDGIASGGTESRKGGGDCDGCNLSYCN